MNINKATGLVVYEVVSIDKIPKTTSGKIQRVSLSKIYCDGLFNKKMRIAELRNLNSTRDQNLDTVNDVAVSLKALCDDVLEKVKLGYNDDIFAVGVSSIEITQLYEAINKKYPNELSLEDLFEHSSISKLADFLKEN